MRCFVVPSSCVWKWSQIVFSTENMAKQNFVLMSVEACWRCKKLSVDLRRESDSTFDPSRSSPLVSYDSAMQVLSLYIIFCAPCVFFGDWNWMAVATPDYWHWILQNQVQNVLQVGPTLFKYPESEIEFCQNHTQISWNSPWSECFIVC